MDFQSLRPVATTSHRPAATKSTEAHYWRQFKSPVFVKEFAPVTSIQFVPNPSSFSTSSDDATPLSSAGSTSAAARHKFAVTTGTRVQIYSMRTSRLLKTVSRFSDVARSANFRSDGRLMVAGDDSGLIQVFDANSRSILRTLRGHAGPVHVTRFSPNPTQIVSASDDRTVRLWDMPEQRCIRTFEGHEDYVRSSVVSLDNPSLVLSGSYDSTVRLWDARMPESDGLALSMDHGAPVEDVLIYPTGAGGVALSAGGPVMRVWDLMMGGRCIASISNHQKTITSLAISLESPNGGGMRVLSGGLDHLVKVYDPSRDFAVTHTMRYPSAILSLAVSPDETHIATGMADGTLSVRKRDVRASEAAAREQRKAAFASGTYEFAPAAATTGQDDLRVEAARKRRLRDYDRLLKAFRYSDALDAALRKGVQPSVTFALLLELLHRSPKGAADGLRRAIAGRDDVTLEPLLRFLLKHVANPNYVQIVCDTMNVVVGA